MLEFVWQMVLSIFYVLKEVTGQKRVLIAIFTYNLCVEKWIVATFGRQNKFRYNFFMLRRKLKNKLSNREMHLYLDMKYPRVT